jgi:hypothetical protein
MACRVGGGVRGGWEITATTKHPDRERASANDTWGGRDDTPPPPPPARKKTHLVLPLPRHVRSADNDVAPVLPQRIGLLLVLYPLPHRQSEFQHEVRSGRYAVRVERVPVGEGAVPGEDRRGQFLGLLRRTESARALLVHLGARRHLGGMFFGGGGGGGDPEKNKKKIGGC